MKHWSLVVLLAACGSTSQDTVPSNVAKPSGVQRELVVQEGIWIERGRDTSLDRNDPCCGISYDANKYADALASCAIKEDECAPGFDPVYPGLADDKVCGERRRCVPQPLVRFSEDGQLDAYKRFELGREGFIELASGERVAIDYGGKYTITLRAGRVERVTRD